MIGELVTQQADLGASPLFLTSDRIDVIDYLACTSQTRSKFVFRSPKLSFTDNVFLLPFDGYVWSCLIALLLFAALILFVASMTEWKARIGMRLKPSLSNFLLTQETIKINFRKFPGESLLILYCALTQQGSSRIPSTFGSRLIIIISFIAFMFLYASYSANIVALLQSPSNKIQTLSDLLNSRLKFGVDDTIFNHFYFSVSF